MNDLISIPEAAELLKVHHTAVRQALKRGDIQGGKVKGRYYVSRQSVEAYKPREYPRDGEKKDSSDG